MTTDRLSLALRTRLPELRILALRDTESLPRPGDLLVDPLEPDERT